MVNINKTISKKYLYFFAAVILKKIKMLKHFLDNGINIDKTDKDGNTALMFASMYGHLSIVRLLLNRGADQSIKNKSGMTAAELAKNKNVRALLEKESLKNNLIRSKKSKDIKLSKIKGIKGGSYFDTELMKLCKSNDNENYYKLIAYLDKNKLLDVTNELTNKVTNKKIDINEINEISTVNNRTALMYACESGSGRVVDVLINNKAILDIKVTIWGKPKTAIDLVIDDNITNLFIIYKKDYNSNFNETNFINDLNFLISSKYLFTIKKIISNIINIKNKYIYNIQDKFGRTSLYNASYNGYIDLVALLLQNGADPMIETNTRDTAFSISQMNYNNERSIVNNCITNNITYCKRKNVKYKCNFLHIEQNFIDSCKFFDIMNLLYLYILKNSNIKNSNIKNNIENIQILIAVYNGYIKNGNINILTDLINNKNENKKKIILEIALYYLCKFDKNKNINTLLNKLKENGIIVDGIIVDDKYIKNNNNKMINNKIINNVFTHVLENYNNNIKKVSDYIKKVNKCTNNSNKMRLSMDYDLHIDSLRHIKNDNIKNDNINIKNMLLMIFVNDGYIGSIIKLINESKNENEKESILDNALCYLSKSHVDIDQKLAFIEELINIYGAAIVKEEHLNIARINSNSSIVKLLCYSLHKNNELFRCIAKDDIPINIIDSIPQSNKYKVLNNMPSSQEYNGRLITKYVLTVLGKIIKEIIIG